MEKYGAIICMMQFRGQDENAPGSGIDGVHFMSAATYDEEVHWQHEYAGW